MGLQLHLSKYLGLIMRYNILEEKEEESIGSMSINGLSLVYQLNNYLRRNSIFFII